MKSEYVFLLVLVGAGYFLFFKKTNNVAYTSLPAPAGANPSSANHQESTAEVAKAALDLIAQAFKTFGNNGDNAVAQTTAARWGV